MNVVLIEPEIPPNTGNIARLCAATRTTLHLVEPFGFRLDDAALKRAGMDYWRHVDWKRWPDVATWLASVPDVSHVWWIEQGGTRRYDGATFGADDWLVFGRETAGLPRALLEAHRDRWLRIPMFNPDARSLNLSNSVALVLYEALRQRGFQSELPP
jgi:tRNA (cytidine/uridine-2'-O-)-methyltransferase